MIEKDLSQFPRAKCDIFKVLLSNQKAKTHRYLIYNDIKLRKQNKQNLHIQGATIKSNYSNYCSIAHLRLSDSPKHASWSCGNCNLLPCFLFQWFPPTVWSCLFLLTEV